MNTEPWYGVRIPVRRLWCLHGFEVRDDLSSLARGGVGSFSIELSWTRPEAVLRWKRFRLAW